MKLIEMKCPNCGAELHVDFSKNRAFCQYCGTELHIEDENKTVKIDDPENIGYQFEKGRQRAEKESHKGFPFVLSGIAVIFVLIVVSFIVFNYFKANSTPKENENITETSSKKKTDNTDSNSNTGDTIASGTSDETVIVNNSNSSYSDETYELHEEDFHTANYSYYLFTVTNKTDFQTLYEISATGYDSSDNPIDVASDRSILAPGETGLIEVVFLRGDIHHIDYNITQKAPVVSHSVNSQVEKKNTINEESIISTITNNSPKPLNVKSVTAVFRDGNGKIVDVVNDFYSGDDLPVGKSTSAKIRCPNHSCKPFVDNGSIDYYYTLLNPIN